MMLISYVEVKEQIFCVSQARQLKVSMGHKKPDHPS